MKNSAYYSKYYGNKKTERRVEKNTLKERRKEDIEKDSSVQSESNIVFEEKIDMLEVEEVK